MKTTFILNLALLILFASLYSACIKPEKKGVEYNSYTEQIVENHLLLRKNIQHFSDSLSIYQKDTFLFMQKHHELMQKTDQLLKQRPAPKTREDSLIFAASEGITFGYFDIIGGDYHTMFSAYHDTAKSKVAEAVCDSIWRTIRQEDSLKTTYFNSLLGSSLQKLTVFK